MSNGTYRLTRGTHYHRGERIDAGDEFEPSDSELEHFGHKLEPVDPDGDVAADDEEGGDDETVDAEDDAVEDDEEGGDDETVDAEDDAVEDDEGAFDYWWVTADGDSFDMELWLDVGYERRVQAVEEGHVDAHLDEIEDDHSSTVTNAVAARRDELEE
jgi:hypothetical protein